MAGVSAPWLLGASGQVGYFLLQRMGRDVVACARSVPAWSSPERGHWQTFDLWTSTAVPDAARLISAGPLDACVTWLERVGPGQLQRIVALGSMSAVHKQQSPSAAERELATRLLDSERRLLEFARSHAIDCTILRPTLIWGAGLDHSLTPFAHKAARRGFALIPSGAMGLRQPVHADDLAALCIALLPRTGHEQVVAATGGGECLSLARMLERVARSSNARALHIPMPRGVLAALGRLGAALGINVASVLARSVADQCAGSDTVWRACGLAPRCFEPTRNDWIAPQ
ncbi:MAG: nucleoside-diphosphate sugar epimerase [Xanthomonadales bacterium]|nr:nucleoside-diphosphate sugar epimerase [Xanthomonadales bacterium]